MNALGRNVSILIVAAALANACGAPAQSRSAALPIVDMHLHASEQPVAWAVCIPWILQVPEIDPKRTWKEAWDAVAANPPCSNPIRPVSDAREAMEQTIAVVNRRNIVGVLSGGLEQVRQWREAAPDRFVPALYFRADAERTAPDSVRRLFETGSFAVLGEVVNQYYGIAPTTNGWRRTGRSPRSWTFRSASIWGKDYPARPSP